MSINHYTNPNLNFNVKSLKINGQDFLSSSTNFMKFTGSMNTSDTTYLHPTDTHSLGSTQFLYEYTRLIRKTIKIKEVLIQRSNNTSNGFIDIMVGNENYGSPQNISTHSISSGNNYTKIIFPIQTQINADSTIGIRNTIFASGVMMVILIFEYV
jgi:hypothetical protein